AKSLRFCDRFRLRRLSLAFVVCGIQGLLGYPFRRTIALDTANNSFALPVRWHGSYLARPCFWRLAASTSCAFRYLAHRTAALLGFATKSGWCAPQAEAFTLDVPPEVE